MTTPEQFINELHEKENACSEWKEKYSHFYSTVMEVAVAEAFTLGELDRALDITKDRVHKQMYNTPVSK